MSKFLNVFNETFLTEKKADKASEILRIFYEVSINITNANKDLPTQDIGNAQQVAAQPQPQAAPAQQVQPAQQLNQETESRFKKFLIEQDIEVPTNEQDYTYNNKGVLNVPKQEFDNIQTLEDIVDYITDKRDNKGLKIIDDITVELIYSMAGITQTDLGSIVKKEDKIIVDIDYGNKKEDSVGIKLLKRAGVNNVSLIMKKDNELIDAPFNLKQFNSQIVSFRNEKME